MIDRLFEPNDANYKLIYTWLQRQFIEIVVKPLGCQIEIHYSEYDCEFDEDLPGGETNAPETPEYQPMEIWVNKKYLFDMLVRQRDGYYVDEPPFDYIMVYEDRGSEEGSTVSYIPFDQAQI